jgi:rubredoxin
METNMINLSLVRQSFFSEDNYLEFMDSDYPVDCKCPKCGKIHRVTMFWTGRGVPRKYCPRCKGRADTDFGIASIGKTGGTESGGDVRVVT